MRAISVRISRPVTLFAAFVLCGVSVAHSALVSPDATSSQVPVMGTDWGVRSLSLAAVSASSIEWSSDLASHGRVVGRGITGRAELASIDTTIDLVGFASPSLLPDFADAPSERAQFMPTVLRGSQDSRELLGEIAPQSLNQSTSNSMWERVFAQGVVLSTSLGTSKASPQIGTLPEPASVTLVAAGGWLAAGARRGGLR